MTKELKLKRIGRYEAVLKVNDEILNVFEGFEDEVQERIEYLIMKAKWSNEVDPIRLAEVESRRQTIKEVKEQIRDHLLNLLKEEGLVDEANRPAVYDWRE